MDGLEYFLTYADNNAVGYFSKQSFTKTVTQEKDKVRFSASVLSRQGAWALLCPSCLLCDFSLPTTCHVACHHLAFLSIGGLQWFGFIKDYDGGTLMECRIHPTLPYASFPGGRGR